MSLNLFLYRNILLSAHVPEHHWFFHRMIEMHLCCIGLKNEPSGDVKNIGPLGLEKDDTVRNSRILLINKGKTHCQGLNKK